MIDKIKEELNKVFYPGKTTSVIKEGVIGEIALNEGGIATIELLLKEDNPNAVQVLQKSIPSVVSKIEGIKDVNLIINLPKKEEAPQLQNIRYILATTSGKGGVGKSTVSANLAISLSKFGYKVGLLDADIYGPNIPRMMGIEGIPVSLDPKNKDKILPIVKYGVKVISIGSMIPKDAAVIWRGPLINQVVKQFLNDVTWGELDFLIVDLPPGTGDAQLTLVQETKVSGGIIVTTPQTVALDDAAKAYDFFVKLKVPVVGVIENMSYFVCPKCGYKTEIFAHGGGKSFSEKSKVPFLGEIPIDIQVREGGDEGSPVTISIPDSIVSKAFADASRSIIEILRSEYSSN